MTARICSKAPGLLATLLLAFALSAVARAAPLTYFINFSGAGTLPSLGVFTYDDSAQKFSNFFVSWNGTVYDLTSAANAPVVGGACGGSSSPATGFALMSQSPCDGVFFRWSGNQNFSLGSFMFYSETLALPAATGASIFDFQTVDFGLFESGAGDWSLTTTAVPVVGTPIILPGGTMVFPELLVFPGGTMIPVPGGVNYSVNFSGAGTLPEVGVFNYDASEQKFSNFFVSWGGTVYNLTDRANAPVVGGACGGFSSPATAFALMSHSPCDGVFFRWSGNQNFSLGSFMFYSETLALPAATGAAIFDFETVDFGLFESGAGDWTLSRIIGAAEPPPGTAPEPRSLALLVLALVGLGCTRRRGSTNYRAEPGSCQARARLV